MSKYGRAMHRAIRKCQRRVMVESIMGHFMWVSREQAEKMRRDGWRFSHGWAYEPGFAQPVGLDEALQCARELLAGCATGEPEA